MDRDLDKIRTYASKDPSEPTIYSTNKRLIEHLQTWNPFGRKRDYVNPTDISRSYNIETPTSLSERLQAIQSSPLSVLGQLPSTLEGSESPYVKGAPLPFKFMPDTLKKAYVPRSFTPEERPVSSLVK